MKDPEPFENSKLMRLQRWADFIKTDEWKEFASLLLERKNYLERQVIVAVKNRKFDDAVKYEAKAEELLAIKGMAEGRLRKIEEEDNGDK